MKREADFRDYMQAATEETSDPGSCPSIDQLTAYLRSACDGDSRESIQEHLVSCDECQSAVLDLAGLDAAAAQPRPDTPEANVERKWKELKQRLRSEQRLAPWWKTWLPGSWPALAFSAACLVAVATAVTWAVFLQSRLSTIEVAYHDLSSYSQNDKTRQRLETELAELRAPQLNLPVFDVLRSGTVDRSGTAQHENTFTLPATGRFALVLNGAVRRPSAEYSIAISHERGDVYYGQGLKPDNQGNLLMTLDKSFLPAGRYRLNVGEKSGSGFQPVCTYFIRFVDQRESPKSENPAQ